MKKTALAVSLVLLLSGLMLGGCGGPASSTPSSVSNVGGYTAERDVTDDDMKVFTEALTGEELARYEPLSVATQVVAGTNYRFYCTVWEDGAEAGHANVVIYQPLGDEAPTVTSIEAA